MPPIGSEITESTRIERKVERQVGEDEDYLSLGQSLRKRTCLHGLGGSLVRSDFWTNFYLGRVALSAESVASKLPLVSLSWDQLAERTRSRKGSVEDEVPASSSALFFWVTLSSSDMNFMASLASLGVLSGR